MKGEKKGKNFDVMSKGKKVSEEDLEGNAIVIWLLGVCCNMSRNKATGEKESRDGRSQSNVKPNFCWYTIWIKSNQNFEHQTNVAIFYIVLHLVGYTIVLCKDGKIV